jgi:hypothetical protein
VKVTEQCDYTKSEICDVVENCNVTLYTKDENDPSVVFMTETFGSAVIDTACTRTVCGKQWLEYFKAYIYMREEDKAMVKVAPSAKTFRFGDGADVKSFQYVTIPAMIGETACNINTDVVDVELPLLLSKASLKKAKTVLDLQNDTATMFQKPVQLQYTSLLC